MPGAVSDGKMTRMCVCVYTSMGDQEKAEAKRMHKD